MRIGRYWWVAMVVGLSAIVVLRLSAGLPDGQRRSIVVALVAIGTLVLAIVRFRARAVRPTDTVPAAPNVQPTLVNVEQRRLYAAWGCIALLFVAWSAALVMGQAYHGPDSRLTILNGLSLFTSIVATAALLLTPSVSISRGSLAAFVTILILWLAGSILLPHASSWLWGSSYGLERVVNAVPGRSLVPVAALLLRSMGHRIGLKMWIDPQR
jgi:hypothetical protein